MRKKGILMPETLKLLIALICIGLLIYLAYSLYGIFTRKTELEQARANLEGITAKINAVEEGGEESYLVAGPKDWIIMSFPNIYSDITFGSIFDRDKLKAEKPLVCKKEYCLCICKDKRPRAKTCEKEGICTDSDNIRIYPDEKMENEGFPIKIDGVFSLYIKKSGVYKTKEIYEKLVGGGGGGR